MNFLRVFFLLLFTTTIYAQPIEIKEESQFLEILSSSKVYIDHTRKLTIKNILDKKVTFKDNNSSLLGYGFSPEFDVWVKFTLINNSDKEVRKILEYANPLTTYIKFFDPNKNYAVQKDGLFTINIDRKNINPTFDIKIEPKSTKTYYLKVSSYITTLIVKLNIWNSKKFYQEETNQQFVLALFFGAMSILGLYNLFIFFFTKDISYFFYFLYMVSIIVHNTIYRGIGTIHLLNQEWIIHSIIYASVISSFPIFFLSLFTKTFLNTKQYPRIDKILNIFLVLLPISVVIFLFTDEYNKYRNIIGILNLTYLLFITIYATFKRNRQAYFILVGWCAIFIAVLFMFLSSTGVFSIYKYFPYLTEASLVFEAVVFSIALADRIKQLQIDKDIANQKLISNQESEKQRLSKLVEEKTIDLKIALDEKNLLLKELHHRVKNNMQIIVSLIRLQKDKIKNKQLKDILTTTQNRISTMRHLHELLFKQNQISYLDTYEYFDMLVEEIKCSYSHENIAIKIDIQAELQIEQAIYCGIMLNELITNSFKYAFDNGIGNINIILSKKDGLYTLLLSDDGVGYDKDTTINSLGLTLVANLAVKQLRGSITTDSTDGVHVKIDWHEDDES